MATRQTYCSRVRDMRAKDEFRDGEQQLQMLDVHVVDVLAHLEALLRHSHFIQRALLKLRSEAPPPWSAEPAGHILSELGSQAIGMRKEWEMLGEIIHDLAAGIQRLRGESNDGEYR